MSGFSPAPFIPFSWPISPLFPFHLLLTVSAMEVLYLWLSGEDEYCFGRMLRPLCGPYQAIILFFFTSVSSLKSTYKQSIIQIYTWLSGKSCEII